MTKENFLKMSLRGFFAALLAPAAICATLLLYLGTAFAGVGFFSQDSTLHRDHLGLFQSAAILREGKFLVAARGMMDPRFRETVIVLVRYDENGAMGLIVNRPTGIRVSSILPDVRELKGKTDKVSIGGPVAVDHLFLMIRSDKAPAGSFRIFKHIYLNSSMTALKRMAGHRRKGDKFRVFVGYAGWARGQLEREVAMGSWHVMDVDGERIFDKDTSDLWQELIDRRSGIMVKLLPAEVPSADFASAE